MPLEKDYIPKTSIDNNDKLRIVTEEDESGSTLVSVLQEKIGESVANPFQQIVNTSDDKGTIYTEQTSVGVPGAGREFVSGEGDSYGVGLEDTTPDGTPVAGSAWHCEIANTTGNTITSATDVTTVLSSDSGSTTGLFDGETTGKYILIGSEYTFGGVKVKIDTLGTIEPGNVAMEYLATSSGWVDVPFMATDADFPYTQKGNQLATCSSCSEQWRGGFNPLSLPVSWDKVTLNINGTDYTKYWARFRITSDITLDPVMEQLKLHTNRFEVNADGKTEYFGRSRYANTILIEKHTNATYDPSNEDIKIAPGITISATDVRFTNNSKDGIILSGVIPEGLDTSIPAQVVIDWYAKGTGAGNVELGFEYTNSGTDFVYDGNATTVTLTPDITSINNEEEARQRTTFLVDARNGFPGDKLYGSLTRDASVSRVGDTYGDGIVITGYQVIGYFCRP